MATPNTLKEKSATSPMLSSTLRKIMFLDRVLGHRNDEYTRRLEEFLEGQRKAQANLTESELKGLQEGFTRRYYNPEFKALAEYEAMKKKLHDAQSADNGDFKMSRKKKEELQFNVGMGPEAYVASQVFNDETIKALKKEFPLVEKQLKAEIAEVAKSKYSDLSPQLSSRPAVVELFNRSYPNLKGEVSKLGMSGFGMKEASNAGLAILRAGAAFSNPSGFLLSKGISALLKTPTFQSITKEMTRSIKTMSESSGLTSTLKNLMGKFSETSIKRVAAGVAGASVVGMVALGVMEPDAATEIYANIKDSVVDFVLDDPMGIENEKPTTMASSALEQDKFAMDEALTRLGPDSPEFENDVTPAPTDNLLSMSAADAQQQLIDTAPTGKDLTADYVTLRDDVPNNDAPAMDAASVQHQLMGSDEPTPNDIIASLSNIKGDSLSLAEVKDALTGVDPQATNEDIVNTLNGTDMPSMASSADVLNSLNSGAPSVASSSDILSSLYDVADTAQDTPSVHLVESGDTLSEIIEEELRLAGQPYDYSTINSYVEEVAKNNGLDDPNKIYPGQEITLPSFTPADKLVSPDDINNAISSSLAYTPDANTDRVLDVSKALGDPAVDVIADTAQLAVDNKDGCDNALSVDAPVPDSSKEKIENTSTSRRM